VTRRQASPGDPRRERSQENGGNVADAGMIRQVTECFGGSMPDIAILCDLSVLRGD